MESASVSRIACTGERSSKPHENDPLRSRVLSGPNNPIRPRPSSYAVRTKTNGVTKDVLFLRSFYMPISHSGHLIALKKLPKGYRKIKYLRCHLIH